METKLLARIGAVVFVAIAITMTVIEMSRSRQAPADQSRLAEATAPTDDPLRVELRRCQLLGAAGGSDTDCLRAWAENRRRFLAPATPPARVADGATAEGN
ncbi:putative entry exclusion protein TrbK-alt [Sphingomonas sp. TX0522]|uniref:putative entry exclusion protein TrbK-alt n=1 Tax=Sphingomonas sp. TX0522 TaxID=2479205 RepID=UPI0018DF6213|nr:putative entry exclusion protein TrbK-alt [Sphingomonas sp. TX0522]MBI0530279.1 conjugal transfer protein TrbK [Sphingomonas sp. TX0522]